MAVGDDFVDVQEAARLLSVSVQHVRRLAEQGKIVFAARGLVDRTSIHLYLAERAGSRHRAWSEKTAWAAVALLSGLNPDWIGQTQKSRLRGYLREVDAITLSSLTRNRATVHRYTGHRSVAARLTKQVVSPDDSALELAQDFQGEIAVDGYLSPADEEELVERYALVSDSTGRLVLRATSFDLATVRLLVAASDVLVSLDASASLDPRESGVGHARLSERLAQFQSTQNVRDARLHSQEQVAARAGRDEERMAKRLAEEVKRADQRVKVEQRRAQQQIQALQRSEHTMQRSETAQSRATHARRVEQAAAAEKRLTQERQKAQKRVEDARTKLAAAQRKAANAQRRLALLQAKAGRRADNSTNESVAERGE